MLATYLNKHRTSRAAFGFAGHPQQLVANAQKVLGVKADGIVGPVTTAAAKKYGVTLPGRPEPTAAKLLRSYLQKNRNNTIAFGTKERPNAQVRNAQRAMGILADGIVGSKTRAAASKYGVTLPARPSASTSSTTSQGQITAAGAARLLGQYLRKNRNSVAAFGTKARPNPLVRNAQNKMGLVNDGIVGPKTRAKAKQYGVTLPPRPGS